MAAIDQALDGHLHQGESPANLFEHLLDQFLSARPEADDVSLGLVGEFIDFAKAYLAKNPPVTQFYADNGLGLMLQNRVAIVFNTQPLAPQRASAVMITAGPSSGGQLPSAGFVGLDGKP